MGLMTDPTSGAQMILTPHPVTLDGQRRMVAALQPGEKLRPFLARTVPEWDGDAWEVRINGVLVPYELLDRVRPKDHALVEVRGIVKKQVLAIIAIAVLAYFTMGAGLAAYGAAVGVTSAVGLSVLGAVTFAAGSALINKFLMPKPKAPTSAQTDSVLSINSARNAPRPYDPLPILFGTVRIAPDIASMPYAWYEGKEQVLGMVLTPGVNVHTVEALYNGDTLLSSYDGVAVYLNGFGGHADQTIPLYSNADTIAGGELNKDGTWIERTTNDNTVRLQINLEYMLGDVTSKGRPYRNRETVEAQYRATGSGTWLPLTSRLFTNDNYDTQRATLSADVAAGQYDVRVRRLGQAFEDLNGKANFQYVTLTAVQADEADYAGIPRIGIRIKATGQLNGALDEVRCVAHSTPVPVWDGSGWTTENTSNPGAHLLAYARGIYDENDKIIAGMGLPDSMIDIPALQSFMTHCAANGYTYDAYIRDGRNHDTMVNAIALAGFGQVTWAGGKFGVSWAADGQPITSVVNMATIKRASFGVTYTLANAADGIEYTYIDPETWKPATLRVAAPGVETMQNPAQVTGEGITDEAHAAEMARYHLAQSLYQYKDISFSQDLEYLSYRRMSVLALQHDMTQWGYGGRLRGAVDASGTVTITLDEPVPAPTAGNAYIGLRIPGEGVYRVFGVQPFAGPSDTLTLTDEWPGDADFPGDDDGNPAHDTTWCYDFKATPGLRVRVASIAPESDMSGARISVAPEPPEFWTYVKTGAYTPPASQSLLQTRPVASSLQVTERQVVQGDTVFTELTAAFDITGTMAYATIHVARQIDGDWGELDQAAETRTSTARFRVPAAGVYTIVVRPYNADGIVGGVASIVYATVGADFPPPAFDTFDVQALPGGVRKYTWSYDSTTLQAPDFGGAEIRYVAGEVSEPDWSAMTPVGDDGFHTASFEAVVPVAGTWTFSARARNTSGELSAAVVITRTLTDNLGEIIDATLDELIAAQTAIDQETADRIAGDLAAVSTAAADATAKANAARDAALAAAAAAQAAVDALAADVAEIVGAPEWEATETYAAGWLVKYDGALYRALVETTGDQPDTSPGEWEKVGDYDSLAEAVAAALSMATANASEIAAEVVRIDALYARMPSGTGDLATEAMVIAEASALATAITAEATRINGLVARMPGGSGVLATQASVNDVASAAASATNAVAERTSTVEARMPAGSGLLGTAANVTAAQDAAQAASDLAGGKGKVFFQSTAPATAERLPQNLWIDTTSGNNTPKRWNGTAWVAVTDKAATDAAAAAAAALTHSQGVDARVTTVESASVTRDNALSTRVGVVEARMPSGSGGLATSASVTAAESASVTRDNALASDITAVQATTASVVTLDNSGFEGTGGWTLGPGFSIDTRADLAHSGNQWLLRQGVPGDSTGPVSTSVRYIPCAPGRTYNFGGFIRRFTAIAATNHGIRLAWYDADNSYISSADIFLTATATIGWTLYSATAVAPVGAAYMRVQGRVFAHTSGSIGWDDLFVSELSPHALANSAAISATQAEVSNHGGQITALASDLSSVQVTVGNQSASLTQLAEVQLSSHLGALPLQNPGFEHDFGWTIPAESRYVATSPHSGSQVFRFGTGANGITAGRYADTVAHPIDSSCRLRASFWNRITQGPPGTAAVRAYFRWYDATGAYLTQSTAATAASSNRGWTQIMGGWIAPPEGASFVVVRIGVNGAQAPMYCYIDDVIVEVETPAVASANARHTVALDVNGLVSGTVNENDGTTSSFGIRADAFSIQPSSPTGERLHWSGGNLRIYDSAGTLRVRLGVW